MEEGNLAILVDAKTEYTKQLVNILSPYIYNGIKKIYFEAKKVCFEKDEIENTLRDFQKNLSIIPKWNQEIIDTECETIVIESKCDWLEDLIMAVFVSHTRILTSINFSKNKNKVNLKIPKVDHFIHQCYIESARSFWKNPYLFDDTINKYEFQRNRREAELLIESQINETIRRQLPVKNILREYLGTDYKELEQPDEEDIETDSSYKENLRKMVKAEIENCSKEKLEEFNIDNIDADVAGADVADVAGADVAGADVTGVAGADVAGAEVAGADVAGAEVAGADVADVAGADVADVAGADVAGADVAGAEVAGADVAGADVAGADVTGVAGADVAGADVAGVADVKIIEEVNDFNSNEQNSKMYDLQLNETLNNKLSIERPRTPQELNTEEKIELDSVIKTEVNKLDIKPPDSDLQIEELNLDLDDLSNLQEVYYDNNSNNVTDLNTNTLNTTNTIDSTNILNTTNTLDNSKIETHTDNIKIDISNTNTDLEQPVKTIIIDTKKRKTLNDDNNLEINDFDNTDESDEDESVTLKKKVYNRYSRNRNFSFFD